MKVVSDTGNPCKVLFFENSGSCKNKQDEKNPPLESVRWLTSKEAAQCLRVSVSSLKMMVYLFSQSRSIKNLVREISPPSLRLLSFVFHFHRTVSVLLVQL